MRRTLLDVNVLLALPDSDHVDHERAAEWSDAEVEAGWASCPVTEHGFVRIISQPRHPSPSSPARTVELVAAARGAATTRSGPATCASWTPRSSTAHACTAPGR